MGKPKQTTERVKGNAKPLSSSRAADLLGASGFSTTGTPIGLTFSSFTTTTSNSGTSSPDPNQETWSNLPSTLVVLLKKLAKRHSTTKLKALEELQSYLGELEGTELITFLPIWVGFYNRLSNDLERRVRLVSQQILGHLLLSTGKQATPHLKTVMGAWALSFFDLNKDVADVATSTFNQLFTPEKRTNALKFAQADILTHLTTSLTVQTKESFSDARFYSKEEIDQRYIRLVSCSLQALGMLIERLPTEARSTLTDEYQELLDHPKLLGFFSNEIPTIRRAAYCLMTALVLHDPEFIRPRVATFATAFLNKALVEKDIVCITASLDALVLSTKEFPDLWLKTKKPAFPKLIQYADFILSHKDVRFQKKFYPILPILIVHLPITLLTSENVTALVNKIAPIRQSDPTKCSDPASCVATAIEVYVALADRLTTTNPSDASTLVSLLTEDSIHLVTQFLFESPCITIENASTLLLKVMGVLWSTGEEDRVDDYLKEIELLLTSPLLEQPDGTDAIDTTANLNRGVDLMADLIFKPRKFFGDNSTSIQTKFRSLLDGFIDISLEKLEAEPSLPGTITYSSSHCFSLLCVICQKLYPNLDTTHQERIQQFFLQRFVSLIPRHDVAQGLRTIEVMITHPNLPPQFASTLFEQLAQQATLSTDQLQYPAKLEFINFLCSKALDQPSQITLPSPIQDWILSVVQNLIVAPEANNSQESSGRLERLIGFVLTSPESLFQPGFHEGVLDSLDQVVNRYMTKLTTHSQDTDHPSHQTHEDILFNRLESLVQLISRAAESIFQHPSCEERLGRIVTNHASLLAHLLSHSQSLLFPAWLQHLPKSSSDNVRAVALPYLEYVKLRVMNSTSIDDTRELATQVSTIFNALSESEWADSELDGLISSVTINDSIWAVLRSRFIQSHDVSMPALALSAFGGWLSIRYPESELDGFQSEMLATTMGFTCAVIKSTRHLVPGLYRMVAQYFVTEVLFAWLDAVLYHASSDPLSHLELDDTVWELLDSLNLTWDLSLAPYTPVLITHLTEITHDLLDLKLLAVQVLWTRALHSAPPSEPWQSWCVATARHQPALGRVLLRGLISHSTHSDQSLSTLQQFRDELIPQLCSTPPSKVLEVWEGSHPHENNIYLTVLLCYSTLGLPISPSLGLDLYYWVLSILESIPSRDESVDVNFWGVFLPILNVTLLHSHRRPVTDMATMEEGDSDDRVLGHKSRGYDTLIDTIHPLLASEATPVGYFTRTHALALCETLIGLGAFHPDPSGHLPENQRQVGNLVLKLLLDEQPDDGVSLTLRYSYLEQLGACLSSYLNQVTLIDPPPFSQLCMLLHSPHPSISRATAQLIYIILPGYIRKVEVDIKKDSSISPRLPLSLLNLSQEKKQHSEDHLVFNQLLAWLVILHVLELASYELKGSFIAQLEISGGIHPLMTILLDVLTIHATPFDCQNWDITSATIEHLEATPYPGIPLLASHLYFRLLKNLPSLTRAWWNECSNRNTIASLESFTERHFSNRIVSATMEQVRDPNLREELCNEQFSFKVGRYEVTAAYELDDNLIAMVFRLPTSYPLKQAEVEGLKHAGVPERQWRSWILGSTSVLVSQNGTLVDALEQFKRNATSHFDGQVDCMICYSMVSVLDRSLPNRTCRTCRNKFHAACLYKWIQSSSQSTCPLCRNLF